VGCAPRPAVKDLVESSFTHRLAAGQELVLYERIEPDSALVVDELTNPLLLTVTWDGQQNISEQEHLRPEKPRLKLARTGVARLSIKAVQETRFRGISLSGRAASVQSPKITKQRPNVIFYLVDTLRRDAVGVYGAPRGLTPNFDDFAADSTVYEQLVASSGWTKPSLGSMFTGMYPRAHGCNTPTAQLRPEYPTLAELLAQRGYSTAGYSSNPSAHSSFGFARGFQEWGNRYLETSEQLHARALAWLDQRQDEPFFLFLHSMDPHDPYLPPAPFGARFAAGIDPLKYALARPTPDDPASAIAIQYNKVHTFLLQPSLATPEDARNLRGLYEAEVAYNDFTFGAFLDEIKKRGLYESSLIILVSDHGEEFRDHGGWLHGGQVFQEMISLPLIVHYPQEKPARSTSPVGHIDLFPTVLAFSGGAPLCDGRDLRTDHGTERALQTLALPPGARTEALTEEGWKLVRTRFDEGARTSLELYDLLSDPGETKNLAETRPIRAGYLQTCLDRLGPIASGEPTELDADLKKGLRALQYLR
jgi:arylsulfatase A-like enzyme